MSTFIDNFLGAAQNIPDFNHADELILKGRFIVLVEKAERQARLTAALYYILTNMITIGGILIVSLLAIVKLEGVGDDVQTAFHWLSWAIAAIVSVGNKLLYEFSIPRKFILYSRTREKYYAEAWSLISGVGNYNDLDGRARLQLFYDRVEKIRTKMADDIADSAKNTANKLGLSTSIDRLIGSGRYSPGSSPGDTPTKAMLTTLSGGVGCAKPAVSISDSTRRRISSNIEEAETILSDACLDDGKDLDEKHDDKNHLDEKHLDDELDKVIKLSEQFFGTSWEMTPADNIATDPADVRDGAEGGPTTPQ